MDFKNLKIETITKIKSKISIGFTLEHKNDEKPQENIKQIRNKLIDNQIEIISEWKNISAKILNLDGYISNQDLNKLNIFLITDLIEIEKIKIGDKISINFLDNKK